MRAHDRVGTFLLGHANQPPQVEAIDGETHGSGALVHGRQAPRVIEHAPEPRRARRHGVVRGGVGVAVEARGEHQRVHFAHGGMRILIGDRGGDGLGGGPVARAGRGVEDRHARPFGLVQRALQRVHCDHALPIDREEHVVAVAATASAAQAGAPALHETRGNPQPADAEPAHHREPSLHVTTALR